MLMMNEFKLDYDHLNKLHNLIDELKRISTDTAIYYHNAPIVGLRYHILAYFYRY